MGGAIGTGIGIPFIATIGGGAPNLNKPVVQVGQWDEVGYINGTNTLDVEVRGQVSDDKGFTITGNNGTFAKFHLGTSPNLSANPSIDFSYPVTPAIEQSAIFTNLTAGVTYYYGVIANNGEGSATSAAIEFVCPVIPMRIQMKTDLPASQSGLTNTQVRLPFSPVTYAECPQFNLNIEVDWGDGTTDTYNTNPVNFPADVPFHDYSSVGIYDITITPNNGAVSRGIEGWSYTANQTDARIMASEKIIEIIQWGDCVFGSLVSNNSGFQSSRYLLECLNLGRITAADTPLIVGEAMRTIGLNWGTSRASNGLGPRDCNIDNLNNWDMKSMLFTQGLFDFLSTFNSNCEDWYMPLNTNIEAMFRNTNFAGDVSKWNTTSCDTMSLMFNNCTQFNSDLSTKIVTRQAVQGHNYPIITDTAWNVSANCGFAQLFSGANAFQNGGNPDGLNTWNIRQTQGTQGNLLQMGSMFQGIAFNGDISGWQVGAVRAFDSMFQNNIAFNQDIGLWDFSGLAIGICNSSNIIFMLRGATSFNQDISAWDLTGAGGLNGLMGPNFPPSPTVQDPKLDTFTYNNVLINFSALGNYSRAANCAAYGSSNYFVFGNSEFDDTNANVVAARNQLITDLGALVDGGPAPLAPNNSNIQQLVNDALALDPVNASIPIPIYGLMSSWNTGSVTNMNSLFQSNSQFIGDAVANWNVSNVTDMANMFDDCTDFNGDISGWNTGSVTTMSFMFFQTESFNQDIGNWDTSSVTDLSHFFRTTQSFNQDLGSWDVSNVTTMLNMFSNSKDFNNGGNSNINNWDTSSVNTMQSMFRDAINFDQYIGDWDTSSVTTMQTMFDENKIFNQDISSWDVSNVTIMSFMFNKSDDFNQDISSWNVANVTSMNRMFFEAGVMNQDLSSWSVNPNVVACSDFSFNANAWTEPKPNFTNCTP